MGERAEKVGKGYQKMEVKMLLCVTGSVAAVKIPELVLKLQESTDFHYNIKIILTEAGEHFLNIAENYDGKSFSEFKSLIDMEASSLTTLAGLVRDDGHKIQIYRDKDEWEPYKNVKKDPVLHIELKKWADILVICPLSANTLAKVANGLADNLLTCVVRAWDFKSQAKQMVLCPAMNSFMWDNPFTELQLGVLKTLFKDSIVFVQPMEKVLACGDVGNGALAPIPEIVKAINLAARSTTFHNKHV